MGLRLNKQAYKSLLEEDLILLLPSAFCIGCGNVYFASVHLIIAIFFMIFHPFGGVGFFSLLNR